MRKFIIAGNWKLNKTSAEAIVLVEELKRLVSSVQGVDIVVCPPMTSLESVADVVAESNIDLGAQNCFWQDSGAFTGEVSALHLKHLGVKYVILGHSERRQYFGETDQTVNKRLRAVLNHGLTPIVCVGETLAQREANQTFEVIKTQLRGAYADLSGADIEKTVIAYEPVWAIGTGKTATPEQAQEVHAFIRQQLASIAGAEIASKVRIQYGGSVTADNASTLLGQPDIDGALVGGASLKAESFATIVKAAKK